MEMEKNTLHSFIHSTTAGRTALYTLYTAGIGSAAYIYIIYIHIIYIIYTHHNLILSVHYDVIWIFIEYYVCHTFKRYVC